MGSVTIKDIAQLAHVSHTTVSRALNGSPLVNEETRQKIRLLAESMNYVPNLSAKGLVRVRSYNIGVFFTSLVHATSSDFIYTVIQSVSDCISGSYNVLFNGIDKLADDYRITTANYDGVLLVSQRPEDDVWIQRIQAAGVPLVVINRKLDDKGIKNIYCDEKAGVQQAVAYLIENGHRDIAYLKGNEESSSTHRRYAGFVDEMEKHHGRYPPGMDFIRRLQRRKRLSRYAGSFETRSKTYRSNFRIGCGSVWRHESSARSRNRYSRGSLPRWIRRWHAGGLLLSAPHQHPPTNRRNGGRRCPAASPPD